VREYSRSEGKDQKIIIGVKIEIGVSCERVLHAHFDMKQITSYLEGVSELGAVSKQVLFGREKYICRLFPTHAGGSRCDTRRCRALLANNLNAVRVLVPPT